MLSFTSRTSAPISAASMIRGQTLPGQHRMVIQWITTNPAKISTRFHKHLRLENSLYTKEHSARSRLFFHRFRALARRTRLKYPIRNTMHPTRAAPAPRIRRGITSCT